MNSINNPSNDPGGQLPGPTTHATPMPTGGRGRNVLWVVGVLVLVAAVILVGRALLTGGAADDGTQYQCPMHPTIISDKPGDCPVCGMKLVAMKSPEKESSKAEKYHCPMHPTVISDTPGDCPICGMKLVPMDDGGSEASAAPARKKTMYRSTMNPDEVSDKPGKDAMGMEMVPFEVTERTELSGVPGLSAVSITSQVRQTMGLKLGMVERRSLTRDVRTSALINVDETHLYRVTVRVEGWVNRLYVDVTGQEVKKGDPLLTLYSPELLTAQKDYLIALNSKDKPGGDALLSAARTRLQLWGISDDQIRKLEQSGQAEEYMTLHAPASGIVSEKHVLAGNKVMPDDPLMVIADLSTVWGDAAIYQSDLPYVKIGMPLELTLPFWPGQTFTGKVIFVSPELDPQTRTLKARLEIPNPQGLLKPGMYADARLAYERGEKTVIPASAVMFTGTHTYAFKDGGDGRLIPVAIKVGSRGDGYYEVLEGVSEGDQVVISANFLVDSESSMKAALDALTHVGHSTEASETTHSGRGE